MKRLRSDLVALAITMVITAALGVLVFALRPQNMPLRVAYLRDGANGITDLWAVVPGQPDSATQLTFSAGGIFDYAPSPDGRKIAFSERDIQSNRFTIRLLDLRSGSTTTLTDCAAANADCHTPAWRPDGGAIAYVRTPYNPDSGDGRPKIWMIEGIGGDALNEYQMFDDQTPGGQPVWSGDGRRLAFYETAGQGVLVYDFAPADPSQHFQFFPADNGITGALSPDGNTLITSVLQASGAHEEGEDPEEHAAHADAGFRPRLILGDLRDGTWRDLSPEGQSNDGQSAAWHPDGQRIAILRQYTEDGGSTQGQQVYLYDLAGNELTPLIVDAAYNHGALSFSPDGDYLLVQRFVFAAMRPQIWVYEMATGALDQIADDAYIASWIPKSE